MFDVKMSSFPISTTFWLALNACLLSSMASERTNLLKELPSDCQEVGKRILGLRENGIYQIFPRNTKFEDAGIEVYCDFPADQEPWTVFQKRFDGSVDFYRNWIQYEMGFGQLNSEFWMGLDRLSELTATKDMELRIEFSDYDGQSRFAEYSYFRVLDSSYLYALVIDGYSGDAGDSLQYHNGMMFTTRDSDNDVEPNINCADSGMGGWWYHACSSAELNALYNRSVYWGSHPGRPLKTTEMKFRRRADTCKKGIKHEF